MDPSSPRVRRPAPIAAKALAVRRKLEAEWKETLAKARARVLSTRGKLRAEALEARDKIEDELRQTAEDLKRQVAEARRRVTAARGRLRDEAIEAREKLEQELAEAASELKRSVARAKSRVKLTRYQIEGEARLAAARMKLGVAEARRRAHEVRRKARQAAEKIDDETRFLRTWIESPLKTGAVSPSSPDLAREMARHIDPAKPGVIVELGPGTGPVTEALLARGVPEERLLLVEYDPDFCKLLKKRFPRARVVQGDAYAIAATIRGHLHAKVAAVVSSLPLMTRPPKERLSLLRESFALLSERAPFIQFTYAATSPIPLKDGGFHALPGRRVWRNIPPARVWVYRQA